MATCRQVIGDFIADKARVRTSPFSWDGRRQLSVGDALAEDLRLRPALLHYGPRYPLLIREDARTLLLNVSDYCPSANERAPYNTGKLTYSPTTRARQQDARDILVNLGYVILNTDVRIDGYQYVRYRQF